ncbi:hypothetical protein P691DRAFT_755095 [Macrolepiota fuliginosa MF-IS2]|uniref:Uncharacterized protein n=1 Tax=Macrolepiota fuliginosa MF-IS2 TaxID=1400762 RepID=A0A9P5XQU4_9AGAR|nr:hypothetical protein P691DRAFT_755095 [Macrolepiota fuliginosa MF-IS2]
MFSFISVYMVLNAIKKVQAFTTYREYPGGPSAWIIRQRDSDTLRIAEDICILLSICLSDGFLLYRTIMFYTTHRLILFVPGFLYTGSVGCLYISVQAQAGANTWTGADFGIPFFIVSSLCHLSVVFAIALRLCLYRELARRVVGDTKEHDTPYASALAIIIESAVLYAVFSVVYIVLYVLRNAGTWIVVSVLCNVRGIASFLIILRAARQGTQDEGSTCGNSLDLASVQHRTRCNTSLSPSP